MVEVARQDHAGDDSLSDGSDLKAAMGMLRPNSKPRSPHTHATDSSTSSVCCLTSEIGDRDVSLVLPVHSQPEFLLECMASTVHTPGLAWAAAHADTMLAMTSHALVLGCCALWHLYSPAACTRTCWGSKNRSCTVAWHLLTAQGVDTHSTITYALQCNRPVSTQRPGTLLHRASQ